MQISAAIFMASRARVGASSARVARQGARGGQGVGAAAAHGQQAVVGRDDVAGAGEQEGGLAVGHDQEGLQAAQHAVGAPLLGQLDRRALEVAAVLLDLGLELREEGHGVGGGAGEAGQDLAVVQAADLLGPVLHHRAAQRDLAVAGEGAAAAVADGEDGRAVECVGGGHARRRRCAAKRLV